MNYPEALVIVGVAFAFAWILRGFSKDCAS